MVREVGAIPPLVSLLQSSDDSRVISVTTSCLRQLAAHPPHKLALISAGAVGELVRILHQQMQVSPVTSDAAQIDRAAAGTASTSAAAAAAPRKPPAVMMAAATGQLRNAALMREAAAALQELCQGSIEACDSIVTCGYVPSLISLLVPQPFTSNAVQDSTKIARVQASMVRMECTLCAIRTLTILLESDHRRIAHENLVGAGSVHADGAVAAAICSASGLSHIFSLLGQSSQPPPVPTERANVQIDGKTPRLERKGAAATENVGELIPRSGAARTARKAAERELAEAAMGVIRMVTLTPAGHRAIHKAIREGDGGVAIIAPLMGLVLCSGLDSRAAHQASSILEIILDGDSGAESYGRPAALAAAEAMHAASKAAGYDGHGWSLAFPALRERLQPFVRQLLAAGVVDGGVGGAASTSLSKFRDLMAIAEAAELPAMQITEAHDRFTAAQAKRKREKLLKHRTNGSTAVAETAPASTMLPDAAAHGIADEEASMTQSSAGNPTGGVESSMLSSASAAAMDRVDSATGGSAGGQEAIEGLCEHASIEAQLHARPCVSSATYGVDAPAMTPDIPAASPPAVAQNAAPLGKGADAPASDTAPISAGFFASLVGLFGSSDSPSAMVDGGSTTSASAPQTKATSLHLFDRLPNGGAASPAVTKRGSPADLGISLTAAVSAIGKYMEKLQQPPGCSQAERMRVGTLPGQPAVSAAAIQTIHTLLHQGVVKDA